MRILGVGVIEFESVGKTFRDGTAAVVDLTLTVPSDKITVIVGPSGCGKTTTLRMVNRMIEPTSGRILWDGTPMRSKRKTTLRRQIGYVIQSGGLFPHRTVVDNVGTVPGLLGWDKNKTRKRSMELLSAVGLDSKLADRYPAQLSGGQQQRVGVARALAADPLVMLMDEPFSAVDPVVRAELHELFLGLQRDLSKTIILITHDIDEAIKLGDQVAILRVGGHLAQVGTPQQVLDEPADAFVEGFVGKDRGFRALSFLPSANLSLDRVRAVRDPASASASEPTLVVDGDAKPVGWADGRRPGQVYGLGSTFDPETDSLRAALDAALTSPVGMAVAVSGGRYAGVVSAAAILAQATDSRASVAETVSIRSQGEDQSTDEPETGSQPDAVVETPSEAERAPEPPAVSEDETPDEALAAVTPHDAPAPAATDAPETPDVEGHAGSHAVEPEPEPEPEPQPQPTPEPEAVTETAPEAVPEADADTQTHEVVAGDEPVEVDSHTSTDTSADAPPAPPPEHEPLSRGRGSEEPGSPSDEFDRSKSWNPFKRSQ